VPIKQGWGCGAILFIVAHDYLNYIVPHGNIFIRLDLEFGLVAGYYHYYY